MITSISPEERRSARQRPVRCTHARPSRASRPRSRSRRARAPARRFRQLRDVAFHPEHPVGDDRCFRCAASHDAALAQLVHVRVRVDDLARRASPAASRRRCSRGSARRRYRRPLSAVRRVTPRSCSRTSRREAASEPPSSASSPRARGAPSNVPQMNRTDAVPRRNGRSRPSSPRSPPGASASPR